MGDDGKFNPYEYLGFAAPGALFLIGAAYLSPDLRQSYMTGDLSLGTLGVFLIIAFAVGHLVQAVGNLVETVWSRAIGGRPQAWILTRALAPWLVCRRRKPLVSEDQRRRIDERMKARFGAHNGLDQLSERDFHALTQEVLADLRSHGRTARIDSFNRTYGLLRGIGSALFLLAPIALFLDPARWGEAAAALALCCLSFVRMHRFSRYYGRELLVEFLAAPVVTEASGGSSAHPA